MNVVGKVGSLISQGVYSVATPFHPFGGAVDVIVVQQQDGTFRSTPWYVRFGKFQGVLKGAEKMVRISVNGVEADFHMYLDNSGEAYFLKEVPSGECSESKEDLKELDSLEVAQNNDKNGNLRGLARTESTYYEFQDDPVEDPVELSKFEDDYIESQSMTSEVVLVSVDGHILTAPISSFERDTDDDVELSTPKFHLGPGQEAEFCEETGDFTAVDEAWTANYLNVFGNTAEVPSIESCGDNSSITASTPQPEENANIVKQERENGIETEPEAASSASTRKDDVFKSCLDIPALVNHDKKPPSDIIDRNSASHIESESSSVQCVAHSKEVEDEANDFTEETAVTSHIDLENKSPPSVTHGAEVEEKVDDALAVEQCNPQGSEDISFDRKLSLSDLPVDSREAISVEQYDVSKLPPSPSGGRWRLWPIPFRRVKTIEHTSNTLSTDEVFVDSLSDSQTTPLETTPTSTSSSEHKQFLRINVPTTEDIASLNLKEGQNMVTFSFSTRVLGMQQVDAHIYLWKWNARIVISDVDGTITKSDVLGQFMPLVGRDWTQSGVTRLFSAIKENGYQLLFLSARAIVQAYLTRSFLMNIKQDGKALPNGPVVISPDGLFPSLFREVIRRAPQEFKIACLEDIKALFPPDHNPFYAGFGNRDTDELSYRKIGIPKGKIFIINPKGEVAISQHRIDVKSYTSLHTLVNDMFPPTSSEQEDFNSWNYWRMPLPDID